MKVKKLKVQYRPYPVVGVISPWNFPLILSLGDAIPALIAGAAVVIKPSEITPLGPGEIVEAWKSEIGGPDVFDVVNGMGETGSALVDEVDFVQFTGSDRPAKKVLAQAAETLTPVSARARRQGPDDRPAQDANVERAANAATWGSSPTSARSASRSSASTSRSRSTTSSSSASPRRSASSTRAWTAASTARTSAR